MPNTLNANPGFAIRNGLPPDGGPRALPLIFAFTGAGSFTQDLYKEEALAQITNVQSVWVDNADNPGTLTIQFSQTFQRIRVPPFFQGQRPVICGDNLSFTLTSTGAGNYNVALIFMNTPMPIDGQLLAALGSTVGGASIAVGQSPYPPGAVPITATSGIIANAIAAASLANAAGKTTYIAGFDATFSGATAASVVDLTVNNLTSGNSFHYEIAVPAGATLQGTPLSIRFNPPIPANTANLAINTSMPALGAGNTNAAVNAYGYQL